MLSATTSSASIVNKLALGVLKLEVTDLSINALVQKYAVQSAQENSASQSTSAQSSTMTRSGSQTGGPGGDPAMGGGPGGGGGGMIPGVDRMEAGAGVTTPTTLTSAQAIAQQTAAARSASGISSTTHVQLAAQIIQLLEKRINA